MYAVLRRIKVQPHLVEESVQRMEHGLVPLLSKEPGFVELYLVQVADNEGLSMTIFENREQTEAGNRRSLEWPKTRSSHLLWGQLRSLGEARS